MKRCPYCGAKVPKDMEEGEGELYCNSCGNEFWESEALGEGEDNKWSINELRAWGGRA